MASFRKRNGKWQAQIRSIAVGSISKTFSLKSDAQHWALSKEQSIMVGHSVRPSRSLYTLGDLLERYRSEITPNKKSYLAEDRRIRHLLRSNIAQQRLKNLTPGVFARFRDERLKDGRRACQYDLVLMRHAFEIARKEWDFFDINNPLLGIRFPSANRPRERRLELGEYETLLKVAKSCFNPFVAPLIALAVETAMRQGELLSLTRNDIHLTDRIVRLEYTKNGERRDVPLSRPAVDIFSSLLKARNDFVIFNCSPSAVRQSWRRLCRRAKITNLTFHDLRHEAISRLFEKGLSVPEVALISGHKTPSQLFRYTQLRARDIVMKL